MSLMGFIKGNKELIEKNFDSASEEEKEYVQKKCGGKKKGK
jgi:hypothetical protein